MDNISTVFLVNELVKRVTEFRFLEKDDPCFSLLCEVDESIVVDFDNAVSRLLTEYMSEVIRRNEEND